jgi:hypothetical protein
MKPCCGSRFHTPPLYPRYMWERWEHAAAQALPVGTLVGTDLVRSHIRYHIEKAVAQGCSHCSHIWRPRERGENQRRHGRPFSPLWRGPEATTYKPSRRYPASARLWRARSAQPDPWRTAAVALVGPSRARPDLKEPLGGRSRFLWLMTR